MVILNYIFYLMITCFKRVYLKIKGYVNKKKKNEEQKLPSTIDKIKEEPILEEEIIWASHLSQSDSIRCPFCDSEEVAVINTEVPSSPVYLCKSCDEKFFKVGN